MDPATTVLFYATVAAGVGAIVRVLKDDSVPITIRGWTVPRSCRPLLALGLGAVGGAIDIAARGTPWKSAMLLGLTSAITAMTGHTVFVEGLRDGREPGDDRKDGEP